MWLPNLSITRKVYSSGDGVRMWSSLKPAEERRAGVLLQVFQQFDMY